MASINTNMAANIAANSLIRNERSMSSTMERLSTGIRINSAKDDAAGLAISSKMTSQVNGLNQAVRNANDAISMIQVAEGALKEVTNMFQRMRELAIQASSDSNTSTDRTALNNEFTQLRDEIARVAANTEWNGEAIFAQGSNASTDRKFQIGANAGQTVSVTFNNFDTGTTGTADANVTGSAFKALDTDGDSTSTSVTANASEATRTSDGAANITDLDITSQVAAGQVMYAMDAAISAVNTQRASLGASMSRMEYAADNLQNVSQNTSAARSRVLDADYAAETTELARTQIIQQAGTAMLAQANQSQQAILSLLK
jgi:flagellin